MAEETGVEMWFRSWQLPILCDPFLLTTMTEVIHVRESLCSELFQDLQKLYSIFAKVYSYKQNCLIQSFKGSQYIIF